MTSEESGYPIDPWCLRETRPYLDRLAQSESLMALSNGHIGLRANLDEGDPHGIAGTYLNAFYESRPLPQAETGYGYPESGQTILNVTNGKLIRLLVDDSPFDIRHGDLHAHERVLDFRDGTLTRHVEWSSTAGKRVRIRSRRLVSFTQRSVAAIEYEVQALDQPLRVILQSDLIANEEQPSASKDPRTATVISDPLVAVEHDSEGVGAILLHRTRDSGLLMAAGMDHLVQGPGRVETVTDARPDWARTSVVCMLAAGEKLRVVKLLAYAWSSRRTARTLRNQVTAALLGAAYGGFDVLLEQQRSYLDDFWDGADVAVEGDPNLQQAVRFALFHVLQAGARAERRGIPGKGLTGPGYDGHTFWDTETFVLPVLTYTQPRAASDALRWRHSTLALAKERAQTLGLAGSAFPWRTIRGQECSGYWPAGSAAFHINADIAAAITRYRVATGDESLETDVGLEVLVETARLFLALGHHDSDGAWHIDGVTGPDEYSALDDDNIYTNLMAARNLGEAADAVDRHPGLAHALDVTAEETASWRRAGLAVHIPYDPQLEVHSQAAHFTHHQEWDFEGYRGRYPLMLHANYFDLYRKQVVKQADLVLAMYLCGDAFTEEEKARNFDYYERRTVRDSSLSACAQAVMAAEVGQLELAYDYAYEAALIDLQDIHQNSRDGLHIASLAGAWIALVAGFGGMRDHSGSLAFDPALPPGITGLRFSLRWRAARLTVAITAQEVTYAVRGDSGVTLQHAGNKIQVPAGTQITLPLHTRTAQCPRPLQPPGREPIDRKAQAADNTD
jgi:alpha,alpha-trehalose phosphorylase